MKCFYHNADLDGKCSGAIVKKAFPQCEMMGINHGDTFPWDSIQPKEIVFMVDFSLQPFTDMLKLNKTCNLVWVDHHKSSIEESEKYTEIIQGKREIPKAACELCWEYFIKTPYNPMPQSVFFLGRYDIWKHMNHPGALEFQYAMRLYDANPNDQTFWERIFKNPTDLEVSRGKLLKQFEDQNNAAYCKACAFETTFEGLRAIAINKGLSGSLTFKSVYDKDKHDIMIAFFWRNGKWTISLYTENKDIDVSEICRKYKGGGHVGAAGCQVDVLPFPLK